MGVAFAGAICFARVQELGNVAHSFAPAKAVFLAGAGIMFGVALLSLTRD